MGALDVSSINSWELEQEPARRTHFSNHHTGLAYVCIQQVVVTYFQVKQTLGPNVRLPLYLRTHVEVGLFLSSLSHRRMLIG